MLFMVRIHNNGLYDMSSLKNFNALNLSLEQQ